MNTFNHTCLSPLFEQDSRGDYTMAFDASIRCLTSRDLKVSGIIGPCVSLNAKGNNISENVRNTPRQNLY